MKKILYIHHGGGLGGAPRSLAFLIKELDKNKYQPIVLIIRDGPARKLFEEAGAEVIVDSRLGDFHGTTVSGMSLKLFFRNLFYVFPSYYYGNKIIRDINPDLVHLNTTCLFLYAKITRKINPKIPVITHVREPLLDSIYGGILKRMNYKYTDAYIAIEEYDLSKMNIRNKLTEVIYNSVDFDQYNTEVKSDVLRKELSLNNDDIIFLYLARIAKSNGTLNFIKTVKENIKDKRLHFVIIGYKESKKDNYVDEVKNKSSSNIHIMKFRNDIPELIASSDVVVSPFTKPHFARSIVEAAAMGVPALISNVDGQKELVLNGKTGLIYDLDSKEDLVEKILLLANDRDLRNNMGKAAEIRAKKLFNSKINNNKVFRIYERLMNKDI